MLLWVCWSPQSTGAMPRTPPPNGLVGPVMFIVAFALQFKRPVFGLADAPRVDGVVALEGWPALEARL